MRHHHLIKHHCYTFVVYILTIVLSVLRLTIGDDHFDFLQLSHNYDSSAVDEEYDIHIMVTILNSRIPTSRVACQVY